MHLVVDTVKKGRLLDLKELLYYKDLFNILTYCKLQMRYAQTFLTFLIAFNFVNSAEKINFGNTLYLIAAMAGILSLVGLNFSKNVI